MKQVRDLDGNLTFSADWTLTATGSDFGIPINGKPAVAANGISGLVNSGISYTLSESGGPAGYTNGTTWACTGGGTFVSPSTITLGAGAIVTCTIINSLDFKPLTVDKTVTATYDRTYLWTIAKDVGQTSVTTTPGGNAIFHYMVTATPGGVQDSNWAMSGTITVTNPNPVAVPATITDVPTGVGGGVTCTVTGGAGATIPANSSAPFNYACTFTSQPNYTGGTNTATATWTRNGGGSASSTAKPVTFALGTETNKTIHVQDNKTTGTFADLGTATWNDDRDADQLRIRPHPGRRRRRAVQHLHQHRADRGDRPAGPADGQRLRAERDAVQGRVGDQGRDRGRRYRDVRCCRVTCSPGRSPSTTPRRWPTRAPCSPTT